MTYPGGKSGSGVYQQIINLIPPHHTYIEGCLGMGAIMRMKKPAAGSLGIDVDGDVLRRFERMACGVPNLGLIQTDVVGWLRSTHLSDQTFLYLDPPYLKATRRQQRDLYGYEFTEEQHEDLLSVIQGMEGCMIAISGYHSQMYAEALADWRTHTFKAQTRGGTMATEWVWMNYPEPSSLHDYRYLGADYREREKFKKQQNRWRRRLERMSSKNRYAMMSVLEDLRWPEREET